MTEYEVAQYGAAHQAPYYRGLPRRLRVAGLVVPAPAAPPAELVAHWALLDSESSQVRTVALRIRQRVCGDAHTYGVPEAEPYRSALLARTLLL